MVAPSFLFLPPLSPLVRLRQPDALTLLHRDSCVIVTITAVCHRCRVVYPLTVASNASGVRRRLVCRGRTISTLVWRKQKIPKGDHLSFPQPYKDRPWSAATVRSRERSDK